MRNSLNIFATIFFLLSVGVSINTFLAINGNIEKKDAVLGKVLAEEATAAEVTQFSTSPTVEDSASLNISSTSATKNNSTSANNKLFDNVFAWKDPNFKINAIPEFYFKEDSQFLKKLNVSEDVFAEEDLSIGGHLYVEDDATFDENVKIKGEKVEINGVKYYFPDEQADAAGLALVNDGNGNLTWQEVSGGGVSSGGDIPANTLYFDEDNNYIGVYEPTPNYTLDINGTGHFTGQLALGNVPSVSNNNQVLTINGGIISSINTSGWDTNAADDLTITGTDNRLARFNASGNNLEDSSINDLYTGGVQLTIDPVARVGIGITAPRASVEIQARQGSLDPLGDDSGGVEINSIGSGYSVGDVLTVSGGTGGQIVVMDVTGVGEGGGAGEILEWAVYKSGYGYSTGTNLATTGGSGSGATFDVNYLLDESGIKFAGSGHPNEADGIYENVSIKPDDSNSDAGIGLTVLSGVGNEQTGSFDAGTPDLYAVTTSGVSSILGSRLSFSEALISNNDFAGGISGYLNIGNILSRDVETDFPSGAYGGDLSLSSGAVGDNWDGSSYLQRTVSASLTLSGSGYDGTDWYGGNIDIIPGYGADRNGVVRILDPSTNNAATLSVASLTGNQTYTFPDASGTFIVGSGTGNYIPVWSGGALGDSIIYQNSNSIGIGNTGSAFKLDVTGTGRYSGQLTLGSTPSISNNNQVLTVNNGVVSVIDTSGWDTNAANDFAGISGTDNRLARFNGAGNNVEDSSIDDAFTGGIALRIFSNGNVGVGVTATNYKLAVGGTASVSNLLLGATQVTSTGTELNYLSGTSVALGGILLGDGTKITNDIANFFFNNTTKRLGIGTSATENTLTVRGNASIGSGYAGIGRSAPLNGLLVQGNVGIGTTNPGGFLLNVNGTQNIAGALTLGSVSSISNNSQVLSLNGGVVSYIDTSTWDTNAADDAGTFTITGTNDRMARFNAAGNNVENGSINDLLASGVAMTIDSAGKVGIGSTGPSTTLDVVGTGRFTSDLSINGNLTFGDASGDTVTSNAAAWSFINATTIGLANSAKAITFGGLFGLDNTNTRVGIGTTAPTERLALAGGNFLHTAVGSISSKGSYNSPGDAEDVEVVGKYAYIADGFSGLRIVDVSNPASPTSEGNGATGGYAAGIAVAGKYAYVGSGNTGIEIYDISNPNTPVLIRTFDTTGQVANVYVSGKYLYAADTSAGLVIIDISNSYNPFQVGVYDSPGSATGVYVSGRYAYVADFSSGLQVVDVSNPSAPTQVGNYDSPGLSYGVYVAGKYAYLADGTDGLRIVDVSNPASPALIGTYDTGDEARRVQVSGKYAYVADRTDGIFVINISVPASPTLVANFDTADARSLFVQGKYVYVADTASGMNILDINGIETPSLYAGNIQTNSLNSTEDSNFGSNVYVRGGLNVGEGGGNFRGALGVGVSAGTAGLIVSQSGNGDLLNLLDNATTVFAVKDGGNVGIGTSSPGSKLSIVGLGTGTGTALVIDASGNVLKDSSSERYKMNIEPLAIDFKKVLELEPKKYDFKDSGIHAIGYIAEQVEVLGGLSDLLIYDSQGRVDGFKYDRLPIYTLEIVKDLNSRVETLEARVDALESDSDGISTSGSSDSSDYEGIIVVEDDGKVKINAPLDVDGVVSAARLKLDTDKKSVGVITIDSGSDSASVTTDVLSDNSLIFVSADMPVPVSARKISDDEFEINLDKSYSENINVNWLIIN